VMVVSVPWQLKSSERIVERDELSPGATRRGYPTSLRDDRAAAPSPSSPHRQVAGTGRQEQSTDGRGADRAGAGTPQP